MALVRIPTPLRNLSSGKDEINIAASNVGDLIEKIEAECPGMKDRLCDESGEIRRFINIYVNN
ncbi:MAG: molybdopterin synthase sulfur carrier subunit, partial [Candidatus Dadabacteria bacterium]|nr:molybdopterin synthase sulfur carrier subunit [Candidatus Dadabacteria bacterium]